MILVTGASGTVGRTVLREVAKSGARHRAMYRSAEEAAKAPAGTEAMVADFAKKETLVPALRGVDYPKSFPSWHRRVEDKLRATRLSWTILRPNSFHQNTTMYYAPSIRAQGVFYSSLGDSWMSYVDVRDVGAVTAKTLSGGAHAGKIYELNGPQALTAMELAAKIEIGRAHV